MTRISIELMEDAPAFGAMIESAMGAALGLEIDRAGMFGTGTGEPRGIVNAPGVNVISMGANGAALTNHDKFLDAIEAVENANGMAAAIAYSPRTKRALAGLKNTLTDPMQPPQDFLDLKRFSSNQFPLTEKQGTATNCSTALLGDFAQAAIALRTGLTLEVTRTGDADAFSKLQVLIRGYLRADIAVLRPAHFAKITGIKPA
jgi:HK97 family phage major capsid protein